MSETTIRKYLRGDIYPGIDSAALVAEACGVPLIWLISGIEQKSDTGSRGEITDPVLKTILGRLPAEQSQQLADAILIHGVSGIIAALNGMASIDEFMQIPEKDRERVMRLYSQIKEGDSEGDQQSAQSDPAIKQRQAS